MKPFDPMDANNWRFTRNTEVNHWFENWTPSNETGDKLVFWTACIFGLIVLSGLVI